ncbi:MAG: Flp family type IVb pilin [Hyphomicrobiaceae bacterium]
MFEFGIRFARSFANDERGATAIEYGLIAALLSIAVIGGAGIIGTNTNQVFLDVASGFPG